MSTKNKKAVVIYSGGMDSRTVLQRAIAENEEVIALSFDYGQKHVKELEFTKNVCRKLDIDHVVIDLGFMSEIASNSSLMQVGEAIPEGHYEAENMKSTVVPNRNMVMLSIAMSLAINEQASRVYYGAHAGDHHIYPDCRPAFIDVMTHIGHLIHEDHIDIIAPYRDVTKKEILIDGLAMGIDYSQTWTCYKGGEVPCRRCGACQERAEAFKSLNIVDPLLGTPIERFFGADALGTRVTFQRVNLDEDEEVFNENKIRVDDELDITKLKI